MRCHCLCLREVVSAGSAPVRLENPENPQNPGNPGEAHYANPRGAHDAPMRDDAVDGEETMILRVPLLPSELTARQIAEHELTGHAVYRNWCRHCVASEGRAHAHASR